LPALDHGARHGALRSRACPGDSHRALLMQAADLRWQGRRLRPWLCGLRRRGERHQPVERRAATDQHPQGNPQPPVFASEASARIYKTTSSVRYWDKHPIGVRFLSLNVIGAHKWRIGQGSRETVGWGVHPMGPESGFSGSLGDWWRSAGWLVMNTPPAIKRLQNPPPFNPYQQPAQGGGKPRH